MRALLLALPLLALSPHVAGADPKPPATRPSSDGLDTKESRLSDARMASARKAYQLAKDRWKGGGRLEDVYVWSRRILDSELEREPINRRDTDRSYQDHAKRMQELEAAVAAQYRAGLASALDLASATYYRDEADFLAAEHAIE